NHWQAQGEVDSLRLFYRTQWQSKDQLFLQVAQTAGLKAKPSDNTGMDIVFFEKRFREKTDNVEMYRH
ncbi:MAG: hypothetical protein LBV12_12020, partial [Puniceicoccales bacterium]|nr:hypothetical protein [Puniceicoccales bacterium]